MCRIITEALTAIDMYLLGLEITNPKSCFIVFVEFSTSDAFFRISC